MTRKLPARIQLICIGTELLEGKINTHQSHLAIALKDLGLNFNRGVCLPDDEKAITAEMRSALTQSDVILVCGGLGPTFDDVTREAVSAALGRRLIYQPQLYEIIKKKFARSRVPIPKENKRQAFLIQGAKALSNKTGSAPGQLLVWKGKTIALLPGPYSELWPMFSEYVLPHLKKKYAQGACAHWVVHLTGIPESLADEKLKPVTSAAGPDVRFTILALSGQVDFHATVSAPSHALAQQRLKNLRDDIYKMVGEHIFGEQAQTLESVLGERLKEKGLTLAVAESCTAGMLSGRITAAPGSSDYFLGGVVAYSNNLKMSLLDVSAATLSKYGAVSAQCSEEMAEGVRRISRASLGISITGIAGPSGGTKIKPVGLVYIGISGLEKTAHWELRLSGDREAIRQRAATAALRLLLRRFN